MSFKQTGPVLWDCLRTPRLQLSRTACLHLLQGTTLGQLFDEHTQLEQAGVPTPGRLHLLRWRNDALWAGATYLEGVVLAHVLKAPADLRVEQLIECLLPEAFER